MKKVIAVLLVVLMLLALLLPQTNVAAEQTGNKVDIMFLHDTHSHLNQAYLPLYTGVRTPLP